MKRKIYLFALLCCTLSVGFTPVFADTEPDNDVYTGADAMDENGTVSGSIYTTSTSDLQDWYQFTTTSDGSITLSSTCTNNAYNTVYLYDSNGSSVLGQNSNYGGTSFTIGGLAAGTYYARYYYYSASYASEYELTNTVTPEPVANDEEPNGYAASALIMGEGATVTGHIGFRENGGTYDVNDWYQFTTSVDGNVSVTLSNVNGRYNCIYLYDADTLTLLTSGCNYGGTTITANGLAAGTYYARVYYYSSNWYSGYTLTNSVAPAQFDNDAEPNDDYTQALAMEENDSVVGHIGHRLNGGAYDTHDWYVFNTTSDGSITLKLSNYTGKHNCVYLYDSDGITLLKQGCDYGGTSITQPGLAAGTYYALVYYYSGSYYSGYSLTNTVTPTQFSNDAEPNNAYTEALPMAENDSVVGHIGHRLNGGDYDTHDWYVFNTTSDGSITLKLSNYTNQYSCVYLYDSNGTTQLLSGCNYGGATITKAGLAAGTYYAVVYYYSGSYYNGYSLTNTVTPTEYDNDAEPNGEFELSMDMETNSTVYGHIGHRLNGGSFDSHDYYSFTTHSEGDLTLTLANNTGQYNCVYLYDENESSLGSSCNYGGTSVVELNMPAGNYYALVYYYSGSYYSGYSLTNSFCPDAISIEALGETVVCEGQYVTLSTPDHHLSYLWSTGATTETINAVLSDDYSLTIDNGNGCVRTSNTITVDVEPAPSADVIADGPTTFCEGGSVMLSVDFEADAYLWSNGETTPSITVSDGGEYYVVLTKGDCTGESQPILITVNSIPSATITAQGPTTFCDGGSVMLKAPSGNDSYLWSTGATGSSIVADAGGEYSCVVTDNGCSATSNVITVTENAYPAVMIDADGPTEFCTGESVMLSASGADSYSWNTGANSSSITVGASGDYLVTGTTNGCSSLSNTITVTVTPCGDVTIEAEGPTEFCDGGSVTLTSSEESGNVWSNGETTQSIVVMESGDYSVTVNGNTSNIISVTVNPNPSPAISANGATEFCEGGSVMLSTEGAYASYLWSNGETGSSITATESGNYMVVVGDANGCSGTSNGIQVMVQSYPSLEVSATGPTEFCLGHGVKLVAVTDGSIQWYNNGEEVNPPGGQAGQIKVVKSGTYWAEATLGACAVTSESVEVIIHGIRVSVQPKGPINICEAEGETTILKANVADSTAVIRWRRDGSLIAGAFGQYYTASKAGEYQAVAIFDGCNTVSNTVTVKNACKAEAPVTGMFSEWVAYPNPTSGTSTIEFSSAASGRSLIRIYNVQGVLIQSEAFEAVSGFNARQLDLRGMSAGAYQIQLIAPDGTMLQQSIIRVE